MKAKKPAANFLVSRLEDGRYWQPVAVETEPQPVWISFWTKHLHESPGWFVAISLYPDSVYRGDLCWTMGLFSAAKSRFLVKDEYENFEEDGPEHHDNQSESRVRAIENAVSEYLREHPEKVKELIKLERQEMRRVRATWRRKSAKAAA